MGSVNNTGGYVLGVREKRADARTKRAAGADLNGNYDTRHRAVRTTVPPGVVDNLRALAVFDDITISSLLRTYIADGLIRDRKRLERARAAERKQRQTVRQPEDA
ncbi:hypothetical protein [Kaistia sp. MMO-174]|uniref:hypothetical protein n=1 Tax=Kaistia sp. MMO-174 TaxID=3081256 RepID=UPI0030195DA4